MTPRCPTCGQVNHRISYTRSSSTTQHARMALGTQATPEQPETWGDVFRAGAVLLLVIASFTALVIAFEGVAR